MFQLQKICIRILIVDAHALFRAGLRMLIEDQMTTDQMTMRVVGEAADRATAVEIARMEQPDIVLLDLDLGEDNGCDVLQELLSIVPNTGVILLTGVLDPEQHREGVSLGALGLVLKESSPGILLKAIEKVYAGEVWLDRSLIAQVLSARAHHMTATEQNGDFGRTNALTDRERQVVELVGEGLKSKDIAKRLHISESTVRHHLTSIFNKLGVADSFELVIHAYRHGLAKPPQKDNGV